MKIFLELMWYFKQERKAYFIGMLLLFVVGMIQLIPPKIIGWVIDEMTTNVLTGKGLAGWIALLLAAALAMYGLRFTWRFLIFGSAIKLAKQIRSRLFKHFTNMPISFYQRKRTGDLMAHATNDISAVQQTAGLGVLCLFDSLSQGIIVMIMMLSIHWKLTLLTLLPLPIMAILTKFYGTMLFKSFHVAQEAFSDLNDKTQESMNGIKVIKSFGQEEEDIRAFVKQTEVVLKKNYRVAKVDSLFDPTISMIAGLCFIILLSFGGYFVVQESLTIGELIALSAYLSLLIWPMLAFGFLFSIVERGRASYKRITTLLAEKAEIVDRDDANDEEPSGNLVYDIEQFSYPNETVPALKDIHFSVNKGETLGVVGKTGAGKTTLLKLLIREFDLDQGKILFGSHNIVDYKIKNLRAAVSYVPQDNFLFSATIYNNIAFADVTQEEANVRQAAKLAHIDEDIAKLPEGYETVVGERGVSLSGGQKQRIAIARSLLLNAEVLILDDCLSAVDAKTEEIILKNLKETRAGKTTIITAHRLSAIKHAQQILVLDQGEIVQSGTHEQLMAEDGWYKEMYLHQQLEEAVERGGE